MSILGELVPYKQDIINLKIGPVQINIKKLKIKVSFNILLLEKDEVILKII